MTDMPAEAYLFIETGNNLGYQAIPHLFILYLQKPAVYEYNEITD